MKKGKTIIKDGVKFTIDTTNNYLYEMENMDRCEVCDVFIPHVLEPGVVIDAIDSDFCRGGFRKVTISDEIPDIRPYAFYEAVIGEIVWPASHTSIPLECFQESTLGTVSNIDTVTHIGTSAFAGCAIKKLVWPSKCFEIPQKCFINGRVSDLTNVGHVSSIGDEAFAGCTIRRFDWPEGCKDVSTKCFEGSNIEIFKGAEHIESIGSEAFAYTCHLQELDLTHSKITSIGARAFARVKRSVVSLPYYVSEDFCDDLFAV